MKIEKLDRQLRVDPLYEADGYKPAHPLMLAKGTVREYWTSIPRSLKYMPKGITKIMSAGQQLVARYLHSTFQENFFTRPEGEALLFTRDLCLYQGQEYNFDGYKELYKLGYLPIQIQALPEGIFTNPNIPHMAGINTVDGYAWLGLNLETLISKTMWQLPTAATIAFHFKKTAVEWVKKTDPDNLWLADYMCHDFHSRGGNPFTSIAVGLGHAMSNLGSDTLNVIPASRYYYDFDENNVPIFSVNASEHSVSCTQLFFYEDKLRNGLLNNKIKEYYAFDLPCDGSVENPDYLTIAEWLMISDWLDRFPKGILSIVNDTMNTWKHITHVLARLKDKIMARDGKVTTRPDSGDPVDIVCGYQVMTQQEAEKFVYGSEYKYNTDGKCIKKNGKLYPIYVSTYIDGTISEVYADTDEKEISVSEQKGVIELLWDIFGGTENKQGYKVLDPHIGALYGDSISPERQLAMYTRLAEKGFAATNILLGIGSYTYVMITRDTGGFAIKGAWFEVETELDDLNDWEGGNGVMQKIKKGFNIYKDPATDDGTKKSLKGFQFVYQDEDGEYRVESEVSEEKAFSEENLLKTIYKDGEFFNQTTLTKIRESVATYL